MGTSIKMAEAVIKSKHSKPTKYKDNGCTNMVTAQFINHCFTISMSQHHSSTHPTQGLLMSVCTQLNPSFLTSWTGDTKTHLTSPSDTVTHTVIKHTRNKIQKLSVLG